MFGLLGKIFVKMIGGTRNERLVRTRLQFVREKVSPLEPEIQALTDAQLLERSLALKARLAGGEKREAVKAEALALIREASRRARNHRHFDVQLVAGMILDEGNIAEEATGEGKTIACYPAIYMAALEGLKVHVVTVNDYLVQRDAEFAQPIFALLGVSVGFITSEMPAYGPAADVRRKAYACDVTYGMNSEFGFDYLRDNMKMSVTEQVQGRLDFAIVDEVDNILIDEARTPLIISGPAYGQTDRFRKADAVARDLIRRNQAWDRTNNRVEALKRQIKALQGEQSRGDKAMQQKLQAAEAEMTAAEEELARHVKFYEVEMDKKAAHLTHEGVAAAQEIAGVGSFYIGGNMEWPHLMDQALRAHLVYERDKDYVVQQGAVLIVDEFTGRILEGRQWSDGLHQAVEAKEHVTIKEETQTIATVTLQNYFKLYKKLAGMTGTAMTEASEFMKIYNLDVVSVPTHRPVNRVDHNDKIFADVEGKYGALVEEINIVSKAGRPVLVGTTSIEKSEMLSTMLTRTYGVEHQVLNARPENAAREADIVAQAGSQRPLKKGSDQMVGTVTIATNMAGRGTDIKLGPGVVWEHCKVVPNADLPSRGVPAEALAKVVESPMFPPRTTKCCIHCPEYDPATNCAHCYKPKVDPNFPKRGQTQCMQEVPCGLHIVGTERHEARRIDNQLRGRAGRQGDPGSSRFFLSLRDDLMTIFAGEWTLKALGWLGLQGQQAIEHRGVSRGIERAQKKVEERNFEIRKNLLEYDEVMDHQRHTFYDRRQKILEGVELEGLVREMLAETVEEGVDSFLDGSYAQRCIAEWARQNLQIALRDDQVHAKDAQDVDNLERDLKTRAKEEATELIANHIGEYMDEEFDPKEWDLKGLSGWAMSRFGVNLSQAQLRKMSPEEVKTALYDAAAAKIDEMDLSPIYKYLDAGFPQASLAAWVHNRFGIEIPVDDIPADMGEAVERVTEKVELAYHRREVEYPPEYALEVTIAQAGVENVYAAAALAEWANRKYNAGWSAESLRELSGEEIRARLVQLSQEWTDDGKLDASIRDGLGASPTVEQAVEFAKTRFDTTLTAGDFKDRDVLEVVGHAGRQFLRREMTELERFVLLQIYDSSWKDHLLAMDHLKSGIGLRSFAEVDPKIAYKRDGMRLFNEMMAGVRDKVADMIFKVRLAPGAQMSNVYQISNMVHEQLSGYDAVARNMADQQAAAAPKKVAPIVREMPKVGRNEPCPCGSGKKYKQCHGKNQ